MTKLSVIRKWFTAECTIGELYVNGKFFCFTLEDAVRSVKIPGKTAIPTGTYKIVIDFSSRFQKDMPRLLDVPRFTGVRIHAGNMATETEGCVLVGFKHSENAIWQSKAAFVMLMDFLKNEKEIEITISNFTAETAKNILKGTLDIAGSIYDVEMTLKKKCGQ